jgi:hypothetical protein
MVIVITNENKNMKKILILIALFLGINSSIKLGWIKINKTQEKDNSTLISSKRVK